MAGCLIHGIEHPPSHIGIEDVFARLLKRFKGVVIKACIQQINKIPLKDQKIGVVQIIEKHCFNSPDKRGVGHPINNFVNRGKGQFLV